MLHLLTKILKYLYYSSEREEIFSIKLPMLKEWATMSKSDWVTEYVSMMILKHLKMLKT